jgi:hypothetical protein
MGFGEERLGQWRRMSKVSILCIVYWASCVLCIGRLVYCVLGVMRQVEAVDRTFKDIITVATIKDLEGDLVRDLCDAHALASPMP